MTESSATPVADDTGRYAVEVAGRGAGVYQVTAIADQDGVELGRAEMSVLVGGADIELTDPRRHDAVLQRIADASGGRFLLTEDIDTLSGVLRGAVLESGPPIVYELWHSVWSFLLVAGVVSAEWALRRQWGLR